MDAHLPPTDADVRVPAVDLAKALGADSIFRWEYCVGGVVRARGGVSMAVSMLGWKSAFFRVIIFIHMLV